MDRRFFEAVATLVGTTIGAGVLGIPYVVAKSGLAVGLLHIIIIGVAVMTVNLLLGEVVLRTKGNHQLTGYAEKYLGRTGKTVLAFTMIAGIYGAMLAYIIGVGSAVNALAPGITPLSGSVLFFAVAITILYFGLNAVKKSELLLSSLVIVVLASAIAITMASARFSTANLMGINVQNAFLPYGVVLFAFLGAVAIPEMKEELGSKKKLLRKAILIGGLIPILLYALFAIAVVGVSGPATSEIATINLGRELGPGITVVANLFAVLAMGTSFISLGLALKEMYAYDYKLKANDAWSFTCSIPLLAFLVGVNGFIALLGTIGAVVGGIEGILIVTMHRAVHKVRGMKPDYTIRASRMLSSALSLMFISGIAYAIYIALTN